MQIPHRLAYVLERDQELDGAVKVSIARLEPWIKHSNLPLFPEYTKHDLEHIEAVLRTAAALIRDEAWPAITPGDAAVLILGILLHDCAMHLVEDGFVSLLHPGRSEKTIPGIPDKPWNVLWEEFYGEASRFDGRQLMRLFGNTEPVRRPPLDAREMTLRDRLLIGEFIRRHHPRLAQEIAIFGVPTKGSHPLMFEGFSDANDHIPALAGLIARSHGENVRAFLPYLNKHFDVRQYKGVHSVFLMTVLRVADYIQVEADRAPSQVLQIKELASPVSQGEWKAHHAIKDVRHTHEDPEALFIDAIPEDVQTFFRVQSWLQGIQYELDASWAVLGEVYGRYEGLSGLGLALRRVRSTLDDTAQFAKRIQYVPVRASFRGSDADLLKLLIEPLYGDRPEIGLRELIQNAVDAVRELNQYRCDIQSLPDNSQPLQLDYVTVSVAKEESGEHWVTITDHGIGMTPKIVVDYFLTAGASFRRSEDWRKIFETPAGRSKVLRAGRFGVGALASFLLGPEIRVTTRHVDEQEGLEFAAGVETEFVELRRVEAPVGTTIRIRITASLARRLGTPRQPAYVGDEIDWDWYYLSSPTLERVVLGTRLDQAYYLPGPHDELPLEWRRVSDSNYEDIHWTYAKYPLLTCNGIKIQHDPDEQTHTRKSRWATRFGLRMPNVSVFDPDGHLPLNLQRTQLAESRFPFDETLAEEVIRDFLAHSLLFGPTSILDGVERQNRYPGIVTTASRSNAPVRLPWYFTQSGFGYVTPITLTQEASEAILIADCGPNTLDTWASFISGPSIFVRRSWSSADQESLLRKIMEYAVISEGTSRYDYYDYEDEFDNDTSGEVSNHEDYGNPTDERDDAMNAFEDGLDRTAGTSRPNWGRGGEDVLALMRRKGARILISSSSWEYIVKQSRIRRSLTTLIDCEWEEEGWILLRTNGCPPQEFDFRSAIRQNKDRELMMAEVYVDLSQTPKVSPIGSEWLKVFGTSQIPFDPARRKNELNDAFQQLAPYIKGLGPSARKPKRKS